MTSWLKKNLFLPICAFFIIAPLITAYAQESFIEGSLWRAEGDTRVYVISNDRKRHLLNEAVFASYGWKMSDVRQADSDILFSIPDVRVVKMANSPTVYNIITGMRSPFASAEEFESEGFSYDEIATINRTELESYPPEDPAGGTVLSVSTTNAFAPSVLARKINEAREFLRRTPPLYPQEKRVAARKALGRGSSGPDVELLQKKLQELGFFSVHTGVNGNFGPATERAVQAFQKANGLSVIGSVGPQTLVVLEKRGLRLHAGGTAATKWRSTVPGDREVLLAAWNEATDATATIYVTLESHRVKVGKKFRTVTKVVSRNPNFAVHYKSGDGVNVQYVIASPPGWQVLANRFPIFDAAPGRIGTFPPSEEIYVPYNDDFRTPEIVEKGQRYLDTAVTQALEELRKKSVQSASGRGLVADLTDPEEMKNIVIIEHIDYGQFRRSQDKYGVVNQVFTILGTNHEDAFRFSGSSKGALGMAQFIKGTYAAMRRDYPAAQLIPGFKEGMGNHLNALQAMALYHDVTGATLESIAREKIAGSPDDLAFALAEVRAAAYNGGAGRVKLALRKNGPNWHSAKTPSRYTLRAETRTYLEKFRVVRDILKTL